jgi:hypothetical protein
MDWGVAMKDMENEKPGPAEAGRVPAFFSGIY